MGGLIAANFLSRYNKGVLGQKSIISREGLPLPLPEIASRVYMGFYLGGQWVFPGFGAAGVMASGYYPAKEILKNEGIDLKKEFAEYFSDRSHKA